MLEKLERIIKNAKQIERLPFTNYDGMVVYDYYDQPLNFSFIDDSGNRYIGNLIEWDKKYDIEYWVCVPVTSNEILAYEKKTLSINELFNNKLDEGVYIYVEKVRENTEAEVYFTGK